MVLQRVLGRVRIYDEALSADSVRAIAVSSAPPLLCALTVAHGQLLLSWRGGVAPYQVQACVDLHKDTWQNLGGTRDVAEMIILPTAATEFYRVKLP